LGRQAVKAFNSCLKTAVKAGAGDCATAAAVDTKGKINAAAEKLLNVAAPGGRCQDAAATVALAEHVRCGPPIGTPLDSFASVTVCLADLYRTDIEQLFAGILRPDFVATAADRDVARCVQWIAKTSSKLFVVAQKEKRLIQNAADQAGGDSSYLDGGDPTGVIARALDHLISRIDRACGTMTAAQWAAVGSCDTTLTGVTSCVAQKTLAHAHGLIASAYDQPGICPSSVAIEISPRGRDKTVVSASEIDSGWTGWVHDDGLVDGTVLRLGLDCGLGGDNDCASCTVSFDCEGGNCRCSNDMSLECDEPFGPDADNCEGNVCRALLGPPQPFNRGGIPVCIQYELFEDVSGGIDAGTGESAINIALAENVHTGIAQNLPCPVCDGSVCSGGARNGLPCDIDGIEEYSEVGDVSFDCPPDALAQLTGPDGLRARTTLRTGTSALALTLQCDPPLGPLGCLCSVCSGDASLACNSDEECAAADAGVCRTDGAHSGTPRAPNSCSDFVCVDDGSGTGDGECSTDDDLFCDGYLKSDGSGMLPCITDTDCTAYDVPGAGSCTLSEPHSCFSGDISSSGLADPERPILVASYCSAPSVSGAINSGRGLPGPNRLLLDTNATRYCADGVTPWGAGGAICP